MTAAHPPIEVIVGAATDRGLRRSINEDSHLASAPLFLVADGMGGHQAGEVASAAVIAEFSVLVGRPSLTIDEVQTALQRARVRVEGLPVGQGGGAGTTLTGVVIADVDGEGYWLTINLGDSRTYRLSGEVFEQISVDHSVVQELVDRGELDAVAATSDSRRNVITRAIGAGSEGEADFWLIPAEQGDRMLVCSDGLSGELDKDRIDTILRAESDPQAAATRLVHEAMLHGGRDNITALVVDAVAVRSRCETADVHDTVPAVGPSPDDIDADTRPRAPQVARGGLR
ncbi:serine/threonine protein phosphatase [Microbacterium sp. Root61]|uniref:PP2C family protein-serine/threonine phosphatase n=1 Tax=Microbacterium sp. Root61 TaxID=1736570 RepID=UPI0006FF6259|nr:protein phosphatase 2C domain-containing protein [Microbacterium sp. Root61]KRA25034.1 serine/threonine protein phosphatase [Microbacterium sp. Root61]